jgi:hypothetical protein
MVTPNISGQPATTEPRVAPPRRKRHRGFWILLVLFLLAIVWVIVSPDPFAQNVRDLAGDKHDQTVLETPFSVSPHSFRYYKLTLPDGSTNVSLIGQFTSSGESSKTSSPKVASTDQTSGPDREIELLVLTEPAFAIWQKGYDTSSIFDSGKVSDAKLHTDLPDGAGVYYAVFNNKFSASNAKKVNATLFLHYKSWVPDWLRRETQEINSSD